MAHAVRMPPLGQTTDELRLVQWLREVGSVVEQGEPLLEVETDKATLEVEAVVSGTLLATLHGPGATVTVGEVLGYLGLPGESVPVAEAAATEDDAQVRTRKQAVPVARRLAADHGIDIDAIEGGGPDGRIEKRDVLALIDADSSSDTAEIPVSRRRRALAERLTRSVQTIPQFSASVDVDMRAAAALLARERAADLVGLTFTHLVLRATAGALRELPELNRLWVVSGPRLRQLERADVGLAVGDDDAVLVTTIAEPDLLALPDLVALTQEAEKRAREGKVTARPVAITVSNLGMFGADRFAAIVDPDQTAILAVGAVAERVRAVDGDVRVGPGVELTLTVDHRVVDGILASRFLVVVRARLESAD